MNETPLPCASCKYNGFRGLVRFCRHPAHLEPINGPLMMRITVNGGRCKEFVDVDTKIMPGGVQAWPDPVSFAGI